jgi:hypothetical protein
MALAGRNAAADGSGTTAACSDGPAGTPLTPADDIVGSVSPSNSGLAFYDAGATNVIAYACIKTGQAGHSGPLVNGSYDAAFTLVVNTDPAVCYVVSGVSGQAVTVARTRVGPDCQDISHIDVGVNLADPSPSPSVTASDPSPSASPSASASASPTASATAAASASPTASATAAASVSPTASATASASPSPSPTPTQTPSPTPTRTASPAPTATATASPSQSPAATSTAVSPASPTPPGGGALGPSAPVAGSGLEGAGPGTRWLYFCLLGALLMVLATTLVYSMSEEQ